jgi:hypothetical protein
VRQWWAKWLQFDRSHYIAGGAILTGATRWHLQSIGFYPKGGVLWEFLKMGGNVGILFFFRGRKKITIITKVKGEKSKNTKIETKHFIQLQRESQIPKQHDKSKDK